jgi:hypothetical protein
VLDEKFNVIWGSFDQPFNETNLDFFGNSLKALIDQHRRALSSDKNIYAGITRTRNGVAFVGIGLVRPMIGRLQVNGDTRRYLDYPPSERQIYPIWAKRFRLITSTIPLTKSIT